MLNQLWSARRTMSGCGDANRNISEGAPADSKDVAAGRWDGTVIAKRAR
jgi:hypothetical protein